MTERARVDYLKRRLRAAEDVVAFFVNTELIGEPRADGGICVRRSTGSSRELEKMDGLLQRWADLRAREEP